MRITKQYSGLQGLQASYGARIYFGRPLQPVWCPRAGSPAEISEFYSANYGVTFPLLEKQDEMVRGGQPL